VANALVNAQPEWEISGTVQKRGTRLPFGANVVVRVVWPCRDGFVAWKLYVGRNLGNRNLALLEWMAEEGFSPELCDIDWEALTTMHLRQDVVDEWEAKIGRFMLTKGKQELYHEALRRKIMLFPVNTPGELLQNEHLAARNFWVELQRPALRDPLTVPGPAVVMHETPLRVGRPPALGEHNVEVYHQELGFTLEELGILRASDVI
jgi:crotonobetainyl-CoA:carnitine CoA-transferase CaiB-like acyl-CoA transferase